MLHEKKVKIPRKIFLVGGEKLKEKQRAKIAELLIRYPGLKGFFRAKEKIRELYRQESREEAASCHLPHPPPRYNFGIDFLDVMHQAWVMSSHRLPYPTLLSGTCQTLD